MVRTVPARSLRAPHPATLGAVGAAALTAAVIAGPVGAAAAGSVGVLALVHRRVLGWSVLVSVFLIVVLLVPMRQYTMTGVAAFNLEPYRIAVVVLLAAMTATLLLDPARGIRGGGFGGQLGRYLAVLAVSVAANVAAIVAAGLTSTLVYSWLHLLALFAAYPILRFSFGDRAAVLRALGIMVAVAGVVGLAAVFERRSGSNVFYSLEQWLPLDNVGDGADKLRGEEARAFGSAEHPIALGAMMVMLLPVAVYLAIHARWPRDVGVRRLVWGVAAALLLLGAGASISRTVVLMLLAAGWVVFRLRRSAVKAALLALPVVFLSVLAIDPAVITTLQESFNPAEGGIVEEQQSEGGPRSAGRIADIGPTLRDIGERPLFGVGFGSRVVTEEGTNARILDNQYLTTAVEAGLVGLAALVALVLVPIRWLWRTARRQDLDRRLTDLAAVFAASMSAFAAGMVVFDTIAFGQVVVLFLAFLAAAAWLRDETRPARHGHATPETMAEAV